MHYAYIYVLRVQILALVLLAAIAPLSLADGSPLSPLLGGVFDVGPISLGVIALFAVLAGAAIVACAEMVFRYGAVRFRLDPLPKAATTPVGSILGIEISRITLASIVLAALSALVVIAGLVVEGRGAWWLLVVAAITGVAAAGVVIAIAIVVWNRMDRAIVRYIGVLALWTPYGYLEDPEGETERTTRSRARLLPGHAFLAVIATLMLIVYGAFGASKWLDIKCMDAAEAGRPFYCVSSSEQRAAAQSEPIVGPLSLPTIPTLGCILVALSLLVYTLSATTFLVDRFRVPLLVPIVAMAFAAADWPQADHYFDVSETKHVAVDPAAVLARGPSKKAVVVAASGGGIFAAAWTAAVLGRFEDTHHEAWHDSVRLVSAVSGGSVGTMYFLDAIETGGLPKGTSRKEVFDRASTSSLDDIAWALVYPDFWRLVTPMFVKTDRGYAAERSWSRIAPGVKAPLSAWRRKVAAGTLPAAAFNATVVDSGGRLVMATTDFGAVELQDGDDRPARRLTFADWFGNEYEPTIIGAVRLSASFPYVSPAARIDRRHAIDARRTYHAVDGGYYDNYGVSSLVDWLRAAMPASNGGASNGGVSNVLVVQIRGPMALQDPDAKRGRGLIPQIIAPLSTLAHFRSAAQIAHNNAELQLLCEVAASRNVVLENVVFQYPTGDVPLSWHLTAAEQEKIWDAAGKRVSAEIDHVNRFMKGEFEPVKQSCDRFR